MLEREALLQALRSNKVDHVSQYLSPLCDEDESFGPEQLFFTPEEYNNFVSNHYIKEDLDQKFSCVHV